MSSIRFNMASTPQGLFDVSADQLAAFGSTLHLGDGRIFVYCENGGVAAVRGRVYQSEVAVDNHGGTGLATTNGTGLLGTRTVTVTLGATAAAENLYAEGYLLQVNDTGSVLLAGTTYKIAGHPAIASAGTGVFTLVDPFWEALSDDATVSLVKHPCKDVIIHPAPPTCPVIGVPIRDIPIDNFGWFQTAGIAAVLQEGVVVPGDPVTTADAAVPGAVSPITATQAVDERIIGIAVGDTATLDLAIINLAI